MAQTPEPPNDTKQLFRECGTCSQTFGHLLDREFGYPMDAHERALSRLAGGIANRGHQCGMLWGSTFAVGAEASRRCEDQGEAVGLALAASRQVVRSFEDRTDTVHCRDITGRNLDTFSGMVGMMYDTFKKGMNGSRCFVLAERWTPQAIEAARDGLAEAPEHQRPPRSCASEVVSKMGGSDAEAAMVAGFGGGMGLSGNACGALGAAVWMKGLRWCARHPGTSPGPWTDTGDKRTLQIFEDATGGEYLCRNICARTFASIDEHTAFLEAGGCAALMDALAGS